MQSLTDFHTWLSPRNARFWVLVLLIVYTVAGFFLVPWLVQRELPGFARDLVQREASVATVRFNPWTLALEAEDFDLRDTDGSALIDFDKLRVNLQLSSLFRWALVLSEVRVTGPSINLIRDGFADTNLGRLAAAASGPAQPSPDTSEEGGALRLVIHELEISAGVLDVTDQIPATAFQTRLEPINIDVQNLSTLPEAQGNQSIRIRTEGDGAIEWDGMLQLNPLASVGRITLKLPGLPLLTRYLDDVLDFDLDGGLLDLSFDYGAQALPDGGFNVAIDGLNLNVTETGLATEDNAEAFFGFQNLRVAGGTLRWPEAAASVQEIVLTKPSLDTWLDPEGKLNLTQLLEEREEMLDDAATTGGTGTARTPADIDATAATSEAVADVPAGSKAGTTPIAEEAETAGPEELPGDDMAADTAAPAVIENAAEPVLTAEEAATDFKLSVGRLAIDELTARFEDRTLPDNGKVEINSLNLEVRDLDNTPDARFPLELKLEIASGGTLSATGEVGVLPAVVAKADVNIEQLALLVAKPWLAPFVTAGLDAGTLSGTTTVKSTPEETLDVRGQFTVDGLSVSQSDGEDLVRWRQLAVKDLIFLLTENQLEIARLTLREPFASVEIDAERQLNFTKALVEQAPAGEASDEAVGEPLVFRLGTSYIENGSVDFADLSLPLPFSTRVSEFGGKLSALASDTRQPSELDFEGRVGEFGQAKVTGQLIALDPLATSAVRVEFRNVNMPDLSPYTVDFAGRKIAAGKLNLDLDYRFDKAQLVGKNQIVVDKIRLGEKVENPDALDLPLGLAIALLSDSNGVIDIKLTIEGNVNDPEFSARGIVGKALANLLVKAVTSPFRLLGSLVGGGDDVDLQNIAFEPGESTLSPPEEEKLMRLGEALAQRPGLSLSVPGAYAASVDKSGIAAGRIRAAAEAELEGSQDSEDLLAERVGDVYEELARERLPDLKLREFRQQFAVEDDDPDTPEFDTLAYLTALRDRLIAAEPVSEAELLVLGAARAEAVANYLGTNASVPSERVAIGDVVPVKPGDENAVRIKLELEAG